MTKHSKHKPKPAKAGDCLHSGKKYYRKHLDMVVVSYLRVSARSQDHNGNLRNQERVLRRKLRKLKGLRIRIVGCFAEVTSGWIVNHMRGALRQAVRRAREFENVPE